MKPFTVTQSQIDQYNRDGYLFVPDLFDQEEMDLLLKIGRADTQKLKGVAERKDTQGGTSKLWLTSDRGEDIYNAIVHSHRVAENMAKLMDDEVYLYHYKMMVKEPMVGGAWEWHQDYGYWYNNEALFPDMASCMIAVDRAYKANGCLQVIKGSHKMGRINHGLAGEQAGADMKRVELALKHMELVYCEMQPGTALFFHANLLHRSDQNLSKDPRWTLICCYNTKHNPCKGLPGHPAFTKLEYWDDAQVKEIGRRQWETMQQQTTPANV